MSAPTRTAQAITGGVPQIDDLRARVGRLLPEDLARGCDRWPLAHPSRALPGSLPFGLAPAQAAGAVVAMYGPWQPHRWLTRSDGALIEHEPGNTAKLGQAIAVLQRWHWAAAIELVETYQTAVYVPELHAAGTTPAHVIERVRELLTGWQLAHRPTAEYPHYIWYWG